MTTIVVKHALAAVAMASLALASPAADAQGGRPGIEGTVEYIRERCDGMTTDVRGVGTYLYGWSYEGGTVVSRESRRNSYDSGGYGPIERRIPLRNVEFGSAAGVYDNTAFIFMRCPDTMLEADCPTLDGVPRRASVYLACQESDKVLNALRHLQDLLGGPAEATDPFG